MYIEFHNQQILSDYLDDVKLVKIANERLQELEDGKADTIPVNINEL